MSYDVAVWEGPPPPSEELDAQFAVRYLEMEESDDPPSPALTSFIAALLAHYPDLTSYEDNDPELDSSPWSDGPLLQNAVGDFCYLALTYSGAEQILGHLASIAASHNLVCYDPQAERLLAP